MKSNGLCGAIQKKGAGIARLLRPSFLYPFPRRPLLARSYSQRACRCLRYLLLFLLLLSPAGAGRPAHVVLFDLSSLGARSQQDEREQVAAFQRHGFS